MSTFSPASYRSGTENEIKLLGIVSEPSYWAEADINIL